MAYRHNGKWRVAWREDGMRRTKVFAKGTPKSIIDRFEVEVKLGRVKQLLGRDMPTLSAWSQVWLKEYAEVHKTPSSRVKDKGTLKYHLLPALGDRRLDEITPAEITALQSKLWHGGEGYVAQSVNNVISLLSAILRFAVLHRIVESNPCVSVKRIPRRERQPTFWTPEEANRFLECCREHDFELFQLCALALTTGLRPGELQGLLRDCLDFERRYVSVKRNWCTKTNQLNEYTKTKTDRKVPVPLPVLEVLAAKRGLAMEEAVFSLPFNTLGFRRIQPMARKAGVRPIRFHDLRHTFASHLVMHGRHPVEVKELLGHRKLETTMKYMHLAEDRSQRLTDCLVEGVSWARQGVKEVLRSAQDDVMEVRKRTDTRKFVLLTHG